MLLSHDGFMYIMINILLNGAVVARRHKSVTITRRLWVRSSLGGLNYYLLIFWFLCSGTKQPVDKQYLEKHNTQCGFSFEEMIYLIFSFPPSINDAKCGVEFRLAKRNASIILWKVGNRIVLTLGPQVPSAYFAMCAIHWQAKKPPDSKKSIFVQNLRPQV